MSNPIPVLMVVNHKGSGDVQVFPLTSGTTLGAQDGSNVLTGNLEAPTDDEGNNHANRLEEAFGKRYLLHGERVYERDEGGDGNWGGIFVTENINSIEHSGLHLLHPAGVPTLAFLDWTVGSDIRRHDSINGTSFSTTVIGTDAGAFTWVGESVVFREGIAWLMSMSAVTELIVHDIALGTTLKVALSGVSMSDATVSLHVHKGELFVNYVSGANGMRVDRLDGTSLTNILAVGGFSSIGSHPMMFSDGDELICWTHNNSVNQVYAISDPTGSPSSLDVSTPVGSSVPHSLPNGFNRYVSIDPDPEASTVYVWRNGEDLNKGTFDLYRYNYRRITHGSTTGSFTLHEFVQQAGTGARGRIMEISAGVHMELTDVTGTFDAAGVITGDDSGATATASSLLVYQGLTSLGTGVAKSNYGLPHIADGGLTRIPVVGDRRPEWGGLPTEIAGARRHPFTCFGTGADLDLALYINSDSLAPSIRGTIVGVSIASVPVTTGLVGNLGEVALEALSPSAGDAYVVSAVDGDSSLTPGALAIAVGDIVEYDGANWAFVHETMTTGFPDLGTHATLNATTALIAPYTDAQDEGELAAFDGTSLTGIFVTTPTLVSNEARNITPTNGATTFNLDHDATVDGLATGDRHSLALDIV